MLGRKESEIAVRPISYKIEGRLGSSKVEFPSKVPFLLVRAWISDENEHRDVSKDARQRAQGPVWHWLAHCQMERGRQPQLWRYYLSRPRHSEDSKELWRVEKVCVSEYAIRFFSRWCYKLEVCGRVGEESVASQGHWDQHGKYPEVRKTH